MALLGGAAAIAAAFVLVMELILAVRGFHPTIVDSEGQWQKQRRRAADLGARALILVGDSRMQTNFDLDALRETSRLEPVELGIDGTSFVPALAGLAADPHVTGSILVGYSAAEVLRAQASDAASRYAANYLRRPRGELLTSAQSEAWLSDRLHAALASYADGARPLDSLLLRVFDAAAAPQYVVTYPDRTRGIDYARVNVRSLSIRSALYELGGNANVAATGSLEERERALRVRIDALQPADTEAFAARIDAVEAMTRTIQARGGKVYFIALPVAGSTAGVESRRYPRAQFWDRFAARSSAHCLHFEDDPRFRDFAPADGLHLDRSQRRAFSTALAQALQL